MYSRDFYNKNLLAASRILRNNPTRAENIIWKKYLRYLKPKVHRQRPMGNFIVDFYIPKARLIIEIDGNSHIHEKAIAKDLERTQFFNTLDLDVIRFTNYEVFHSFEFVCRKIEHTINLRKTFQSSAVLERHPRSDVDLERHPRSDINLGRHPLAPSERGGTAPDINYVK